MPRRKKSSFKRDIGVDPLYGSELIQKLINVVMWRGKKNTARAIVYDALDVLIKKNKGDLKRRWRYFTKGLKKSFL